MTDNTKKARLDRLPKPIIAVGPMKSKVPEHLLLARVFRAAPEMILVPPPKPPTTWPEGWSGCQVSILAQRLWNRHPSRSIRELLGAADRGAQRCRPR